MFGLGTNIILQVVTSSDPLAALVSDFTTRVANDSGTTDAEGCLTAELTTLNDIE